MTKLTRWYVWRRKDMKNGGIVEWALALLILIILLKIFREQAVESLAMLLK